MKLRNFFWRPPEEIAGYQGVICGGLCCLLRASSLGNILRAIDLPRSVRIPASSVASSDPSMKVRMSSSSEVAGHGTIILASALVVITTEDPS
ncbi:unnamed protein product [Echinostoma caproni]|uniref:Uncharacterized protein n=1 Tax=Echinostoma caproni TaxID=27848 RepID=A0A183AAE5_9TREM|nr:unnamed protein product [Echinostoma caproni]